MWKKVRRPQEEKSRYIKRLKKCWIYKENQDMKKLVSTDFSAENWLILGKKWSMMIATADKYGCRTLPMRNWHSSRVVASSDVSSASSGRTLPMRNWHIFVVSNICRENALRRTLPMRNWHLSDATWLKSFPPFKHTRRTLPMRNWHSSFFLFRCRLNTMSDITYEELTHNSNSSYVFIFLSDITYEELT